MLKIRCTVCQKNIAVPEAYVGRLVKCPACKGPILVSTGAPSLPPIRAAVHGGSVVPAPDATPSATEPEVTPRIFEPPPERPSDVVAQIGPPVNLSPHEFLQRRPEVVAAIAVASACALLSVVRAMLETNSHAGGSPLWDLLAAAMYVWVAVQSFRRSDQVRHVGMTMTALAAALAVTRLLGDHGTPVDVLDLVLSAGLFTLLFSSKESFPTRRGSANVAFSRLRSGVVAGMANVATSRSTTRLTNPIARDPSPLQTPTPSATLATEFRALYGMLSCTIVFLFLLVLSSYRSLPTRWTHLFIDDLFGNWVGIGILVGGIYAAVWMRKNRAALPSLNGPQRRRGLIGPYGMILLMVVGGSTTLGALSEKYLTSPLAHVAASGPTFLDFDGKYGATAVDQGRSIDRSHLTTAQAESELKSYLGQTVRWQGTVVDVKGDLVMVRVIPTTAELVLNGNMNAAANRQIAHDSGTLGQDEV